MKVKPTANIDRIGISAVQLQFERLGYTVREQPISDRGMVVVGCRMVNPGLAFMERHNDLHPSYSTLSFARISRLYRQINNLRQISCIISDFENESVLRTKRAKRWRNVLLNRSICAVCPVSFPEGRCFVTGMTA